MEGEIPVTTYTQASAHRGYKSRYDVIKGGPMAGALPSEDCAIDWPDFAEEGEPIHLIMTGNDEFCTCGLAILEKAGARFR